MRNELFLSTVRFFSFALLFGILFSACSNSEVDLALADETPTLRYTADFLYDSTTWTEELEVDRLTSKVSAINGVSPKLNLSPLIVSACVPSENSHIFPSLDSFGSLDTSLIPSGLKKTLVSFSETLSKNQDTDSFFAKENLYSLALFYNEFNRIFGECFELNKVQEPKQEGEESEKSAESQEIFYFTSFKLGQPFLNGIYYEIPIKFFSEKATLTVSVFCFEESGLWKIDQIQIGDWEIF